METRALDSLLLARVGSGVRRPLASLEGEPHPGTEAARDWATVAIAFAAGRLSATRHDTSAPEVSPRP